MERPFESIYAEYGRSLHGYLVRLTCDRGIAEELCQETFLRYLRDERRLAAMNGALKPWLFRVATNLARDRWRRRQRGHAVPLAQEPAATDQLAAVDDKDAAARIRREVARLPIELREAFLLRAHHELTYAAVGDATGVSVRTAKLRFRRARDILAHRLAPHFPEDKR